jgi:hypothetical protein
MKREPFGVFDGLDRQINVEFRPVKVIRTQPPNIQEFFHRRISEPRKLVKIDKESFSSKVESKPVPRDARDVNVCGVRASVFRFCDVVSSSAAREVSTLQQRSY